MNFSKLDRKTSRNYTGWFFVFLLGLHMVLNFMNAISDPESLVEMTDSMIICSNALLAIVLLLSILIIWTLIADENIDKNFNIGLLVGFALFIIAAFLTDGVQVFQSPSIYFITAYGPVAAVFEWSTKKTSSNTLE